MRGGVREYARHRAELGLSGQSHTAVRKALATKRIGAGEDGKLDFEACDAAWRENSTPVLSTAQQSIASNGSSEQHDEPAPGQICQAAPPEQKKPDGSEDFQSAKTREQRAAADLAELKRDRERGRSIDMDEARKTFTAIGRIYATARENMPTQLAPLLIGKNDLTEIEIILRKEFRGVDDRVATEIEQRFAQVAVQDNEQVLEDSNRDAGGRAGQ